MRSRAWTHTGSLPSMAEREITVPGSPAAIRDPSHDGSGAVARARRNRYTLWRPSPEQTRSQLTCASWAANQRQSSNSTAVRGEVSVPALRGHHDIAAAIPDQAGLTEPGSGRDDGLRPMRARLADGQRLEVLRLEQDEAVSVRGQVVDQVDGRQAERLRHPIGHDPPGQVRGLHPPLVYRPRHAEAGPHDPRRVGGQEDLDHLLQAALLPAGIGLEGRGNARVVGKERDPCVGGTDVARQDRERTVLRRQEWRGHRHHGLGAPPASTGEAPAFAESVPYCRLRGSSMVRIAGRVVARDLATPDR